MATTTTPPAAEKQTADALPMQRIPLKAISVQDGFNPRGQVTEDAEFDALLQTIRDRGVLQPILVQPADQADRYVLIAGERRYRAALQAQLTEIPALVRPAIDGDDAQLERLADAVIENELRSDLNPVQRAAAYRAMLDYGCTLRGLAERLGGKTRRSTRERRIKEHLQILELPEDLQQLIAQEQVPMLAIRALVEVCNIHPDLARVAAKSVLDPAENEDPYTWAEIAREALAVAVRNSNPLPDGIFETYEQYPLAQFTIAEKTAKQLAAFQQLTGRSLDQVTFTPALIEAVRPFGVVHDVEGWSAIVAGQDVADRLAEDYIAAQLKAAREQAKHRGQLQRGQQQPTPSADPGSAEAGAGQQTGEQQADEAKRKRDQQRQERQAATRFNLQLGVLALKHLARMKVDERVLRILAAVDFGAHLGGIAARGARLTLPGWPIEQTTGTGKAKTVYLDVEDAERKAREFLTAASSAGEIAGRAVTLIALAEFADEQAIAASRRSFDTQTFSGPWAVRAERDLHELVSERIKEGQLPQLDKLLAARVKQIDQRAEEEQKIAQAIKRLEQLPDDPEQLADQELAAALADAELAFGRYSLRTQSLRRAAESRDEGSSGKQTAGRKATAAQAAAA